MNSQTARGSDGAPVTPRGPGVQLTQESGRGWEFVGALADIAFILDPNAVVLEVVVSRPDLLYASPETMVGQRLKDLLPPSLAETAGRAVQAVVQTGETRRFQYPLAVPAGDRWFEARLARMGPDVTPGAPAIVGLIQDITPQKDAQAALRESEIRLHTVTECLPFDFWILGRDGTYVLQNSTCRRHWGDVIGRRPRDVAPDEETRTLWEENNRRAMAGELVEGDVIYSVDGTPRRYRNVLAPIRDGDRVSGVLGLNIDVTDQWLLAQNMQKAQRLESLGLLAGGIAHDFNNLLTGVLGHISLARLKEGVGDDSQRLLARAERACFRAQTLTQQLLTFAKGGQPVRKVVALGSLVEEAVRFGCSGSSSRCVFELAEDLWPVSVDSGQINQVVNNLVLNAIQAMPSGGTITVKGANAQLEEKSQPPLPAGRYILLSIEDEGPGIDEAILPRVFDPYFTTSDEGHGLGLAVAYSIVNNHGGAISVTSNPGRGAKVEILLPVSPEKQAAEASPVAKHWRGGGRILVLEDEPDLRSLTDLMLQRLGYQSKSVGTCEAAVRLYQEGVTQGSPFDLVILDLTVAGGPGGRECLAQLRTLDPTVRGIVASGYSNDPVLAHPHDFGFVAVLPKPFSLDRLEQVLFETLAEP